MPTLAHKKRAADIRQYFQEHWLTSDDWLAIRADIIAKFGLKDADWARFRPLLRSIQADQGATRQGRKPGGYSREAVLEYFRRNLARKVTDAGEVRQEIMVRFGISQATWYSLKRVLQGIIDEVRQRTDNGALVVPNQEEQPEPLVEEQVLEIPANVSPEAKACINLLLAKNHHLASEVQLRDVEIAGQRGQIAQGQSRSRLLKKIIGELLEVV